MQKKLIALAIAGLSGAAYAQSNVTIYGVVDNTIENTSVTGLTGGNRLSANSSYLGFKGEENLGNGLKAKFLFEQGLNTDDTKNGAGSTAATNNTANAGLMGTASRDAWVSLSSDQAGEVRLGTFNRATRTLGSMVDYSWGYAGSTTFKGVMGTVGGTIKTGADERINNAVGYFSPVFAGGLQLSATYGLAEAATTNSTTTSTSKTYGNKAYDFGALYNNGPIKAGLAYARTYNGRYDTTAVSPTATDNAYVGTTRIGGAYTFPTNTTISAMWDRSKVQDNTVAASGTRNAWDIGAKQAFGAHSVFAQYSKANSLNLSNVAASKNNGDKQITVGYGYDFSKRTTLKAYWTRLSNSSDGTAGFYDNAIAAPTAGGSSRIVGAGIRHSF